MKAAELKKKSTEELNAELHELLQEQFKLRMQKSFSENVRPHHFRNVRRAIARVKTILREKVMQS